MVNVLDNSAFNMTPLTDSINLMPLTWGTLGKMKLFPDKGVVTRFVTIEYKNGLLHLLKSGEVNGPASVGKSGKRNVKTFEIPTLMHEDSVMATAVQGLRGFGQETQLATVADLVNDKLDDMKARHDITREWLRVGALKGIILDGDNSTVLHNLYTSFGITPKVLDFVFGTATTNIIKQFMALKRHVEENLLGDTFTHIEVLCGKDWFADCIDHAKVVKAWERWQNGKALRSDLRMGFEIVPGVFLREYNDQAPISTGGANVPFIAADEAYAAPAGTRKTMKTFNAPADFVETVNTMGRPYYAKREVMKFGRGHEIHTQSNPLAMCMQPATLVKCTQS